MIDYAVALIFPGAIAKELDRLREKYLHYVGYTIEPHLTLAYPFLPQVDISLVKERLNGVSESTKPFTLILEGVEYFEGKNNVAYAAIKNKQPVVALHIDIRRALSGLIKEEYTNSQFNLERFTPHVTIGEQIPEDVFQSVKKMFSDYRLHYEIEMDSFALFFSDEDGVWKPDCLFKLSG